VIAFQKYTPGAGGSGSVRPTFTRVFHDPEFTRLRNTLTFTLLALLIGFAARS